MNTKEISDLLLKVGGMLILIMCIPNIHYYILIYGQFEVKSVSLFLSTVIVPNMLPIIVGFFLFIKPGKITNKVITGINDESCSKTPTLLQIEQVCLSVLGYYLFITSLGEVIFQVSNFIQAKANVPYNSVELSVSLIFTPDFISVLFELMLAIFLILGSSTISKFVHKIKEPTKIN